MADAPVTNLLQALLTLGPTKSYTRLLRPSCPSCALSWDENKFSCRRQTKTHSQNETCVIWQCKHVNLWTLSFLSALTTWRAKRNIYLSHWKRYLKRYWKQTYKFKPRHQCTNWTHNNRNKTTSSAMCTTLRSLFIPMRDVNWLSARLVAMRCYAMSDFYVDIIDGTCHQILQWMISLLVRLGWRLLDK